MQRFEYEITALPALPAIGDAPFMSPRELRDLLGHTAKVRRVVDVILLAHDLDLFISIHQGQQIEETPFVLTPGQLSKEAPLPSFLTEGVPAARELSFDDLWQRYFRHVASLGLVAKAHILPAWAGFEVTLRNALAERRSRLAGHSFPPPLVAEELCDHLGSMSKQTDAWAAATDPLSAQQALTSIRKTWIEQHRRWYSFALDEIAAYALEWLIVYQAHKCHGDQAEASR